MGMPFLGREQRYELHSDRVTITTDSSGRQRKSTDGASQVMYAAALAARTVTWLRDEQAKAVSVQQDPVPEELA